jgi:hypothetical protein
MRTQTLPSCWSATSPTCGTCGACSPTKQRCDCWQSLLVHLLSVHVYLRPDRICR